MTFINAALIAVISGLLIVLVETNLKKEKEQEKLKESLDAYKRYSERVISEKQGEIYRYKTRYDNLHTEYVKIRRG